MALSPKIMVALSQKSMLVTENKTNLFSVTLFLAIVLLSVEQCFQENITKIATKNVQNTGPYWSNKAYLSV